MRAKTGDKRIVVVIEFQFESDVLPDPDRLSDAAHGALRTLVSDEYENLRYTADWITPGESSCTGLGGGTRRGMKIKVSP